MAPKTEQFQPKMDDKALLAFKRKKSSSQTTTSKDLAKVDVVDIDQEASSTTRSELPVKKARSDQNEKARTEPSNQAGPVNPTALGDVSGSSRPPLGSPPPYRWWHLFQNFEGKPESEVSSIFYRRMPVEQLVGSNFCYPENRTQVSKVGLRNVSKMSQILSVQNAFFAHSLDYGLNVLEQTLKERDQVIKKLNEQLNQQKKNDEELAARQLENKTLAAEKAKLEEDLQVARTAQKKAEEALATCTEEKAILSSKLIDDKNASEEEKSIMLGEKTKLEEEVEALKGEIMFHHERGFNKVVDQVRFLHPSANLDDIGVFKIIEDGKLVDMTVED